MAISAPVRPEAWKFKVGPWTPVNYYLHAKTAFEDVNLLPHSENQGANLRWMGTPGSFCSSLLFRRFASNEIIAVRIRLEETCILSACKLSSYCMQGGVVIWNDD